MSLTGAELTSHFLKRLNSSEELSERCGLAVGILRSPVFIPGKVGTVLSWLLDTLDKKYKTRLAAACLALSRHSLGPSNQVWPEDLVNITGYEIDNLKECLLALHSMWEAAASSLQQAINDKYKSSK